MHDPITPMIFIISILIVIGAGVIALKSKTRGNSKQYKFQLQNPLTENEEAMYWKLTAALPEQIVLAQVAVSSVIRGKDIGSRGTIAQLSFDFLICTKGMQPIAAIEIDDKTHDRPERQKADQNKQRACDETGLRLIRWKSHKHPTAEEIVKAIRLKFYGKDDGSETPE